MGKTTIMLSRLESITIYPHMQYGLGLAENITYEVRTLVPQSHTVL